MKRLATALVAATLAVIPLTAQASTKPVVPCRSCTYWTAAETTRTIDGIPVTIRGFAEHVVYRNGQDHVRNLAWAGETDTGPLAFDDVRARLTVADVPVTDDVVWDPAERWGQEYVGRDNGRTALGIDLVVEARWRGKTVVVVVDPRDVIEGERGSVPAGVR